MALIDNLISYYKLDENAANTTVADSHGSDTGTASTNTSNLYDASGKINSCFNLNGSTEWVNTGTAQNMQDAISISAWVKFTFIDENAIVAKLSWSGGGNRVFNLYMDGSGYMRFQIGASTNAVSASVLSTGTWYHIVGTYDMTNIKLYIDNGTPTTTAYTAQIPSNTTTHQMIGCYKNNDDGVYAKHNGIIEEVGIWNKVLTSAEVNSLYNSGSGLAYPFSTATLRLIKLSGTFVEKPILTKVAGTFVDKPIKIKVGGVFQ